MLRNEVTHEGAKYCGPGTRREHAKVTITAIHDPDQDARESMAQSTKEFETKLFAERATYQALLQRVEKASVDA
jgi:hypothetical protein